MTRSRWHDGYYHMGDMAWMDEEGYLWFVGRADDVIKTSGYRVGPFEVESVVMQHPAVLECAITGVPDPTCGQVIKATIVPARGFTPTEELKKEIQNFVKENTAPYKYPRVIEIGARWNGRRSCAAGEKPAGQEADCRGGDRCANQRG